MVLANQKIKYSLAKLTSSHRLTDTEPTPVPHRIKGQFAVHTGGYPWAHGMGHSIQVQPKYNSNNYNLLLIRHVTGRAH